MNCMFPLYQVGCSKKTSGQRYPALSVSLLAHRSVGQSVSPFVGPSITLYFFWFLHTLTSLLLPKLSNDFKYDPYPPARDWGSHVSSLIFFTPPPPVFHSFPLVYLHYSLWVACSVCSLAPFTT